MDIVVERTARKATKSKVQSSLKPSPVAGDALENTEQARVSMIVDAIKNRNNRDPPKQVKETDAANVVVGVNEAVDQVKEKGRRKK
nr:hypothetical protein [Tanacetum cinerariifolium]